MLIQMVQENLQDFYMDNSFCNNKMGIWLAPSEGLLLHKLNFDSYNKKNGIAETMELKDDENLRLENFKMSAIYKEVLDAEEERGVFTKWIVDFKSYDENQMAVTTEENT